MTGFVRYSYALNVWSDDPGKGNKNYYTVNKSKYSFFFFMHYCDTFFFTTKKETKNVAAKNGALFL